MPDRFDTARDPLQTRFSSDLSAIGLGAAQFGNLYRETTQEATDAAVEAAWAAGIRYFDTAPHYGLGLSETRLGRALRGLPRHDYTISTKVGRLLVPAAQTGRMDDEGFVVPATHRREWDFSADGILRSVEQSLLRLGLDRIDILYLHDPDDHWEVASRDGMDALTALRDEGVVKAVGVGMNQAAMLADFVRECDVDLVMLAGRFTLLDQSALDTLLPLAIERGVGVVAAGVFNSGVLSATQIPVGATYDYQEAAPDVIERARRIARMCEQFGVSLPAAAIAYPARHPSVVSTVLGMRSAEQVRENMRRASEPVPEALWHSLHAAGLVKDPAA